MNDKKFKITLLEQVNPEAEAAFTHYLHNHKNGVSQFYKEDAIEYLKNFIKYKFPEEPITNIAAEEALQHLLFEQDDVPFPAPSKPKFKFIDLFAGIGGFRLAMQNLGGVEILSSIPLGSSDFSKELHESILSDYSIQNYRC